MKKTIKCIVTLLTITALTACTKTTQAVQATQAAPVAPTTLDGEWTQAGEITTDQSYQYGAIADGTITIYWDMRDDSAWLYWQGSAPETPQSWTSSNTRDKTQISLLASQDDTKDFVYHEDNDTISYDVSALGQTKTVTLRRVGE